MTTKAPFRTYGPLSARIVQEKGAPMGSRPNDVDLLIASHIDDAYEARNSPVDDDEARVHRLVEGRSGERSRY